jgi:hypothetical protein
MPSSVAPAVTSATGSPAPGRRRQLISKAVGGLAALAAAGVALAACSGGTVADWARSTGAGGNDYQLVSDIAHLRSGILLHQLARLRVACEATSNDASTADGELPTPDHALTEELNTAYLDLYDGGVDCYEASSFSSAKFARFERLLDAGASALVVAERRLGALAPGANQATGGSGQT